MAEESSIEALEERIKELEEKIKNSNSTDQMENTAEGSKGISRRDFLKKAGLGLGGLTALASPVSADYFIKDDSFSVQTSNDGGSTLTEGLFVDSNQNVSIPSGFLSLPDANGVDHRFEPASDGSSGLTLRTTTNQDEIFQVRSSGQAVRFAVYHNNKTYVGDDLEVNNQIFENGTNRVATRNWVNDNASSGGPIYGTGSDGSITYSSNTAISGVVKATDLTVQSGVTVTVDGFAAIYATRNVEINGTIDASGQGAAGGDPNSGNGANGRITPISSGGSGGNGQDKAGNGGAGGDGDLNPIPMISILEATPGPLISELSDGSPIGAGGGAGGRGWWGDDNYSGAHNGGNGSSPGGGGGGAHLGGLTTQSGTTNGGSGGNGGGGVVIVSPYITISGTIDCSGDDGENGNGSSYSGSGGGGGGSGGFIYLAGDITKNSPTLNVSGGSGGSGGGGQRNGGNGASGANGSLIETDTS